jgi:hypothetical protein
MVFENTTTSSSSKTKPIVPKKAKRLSKHKRESKKKKLVKAIPPPIPSTRNYIEDLEEYLSLWEEKENGSGWKFNKKIQTWAIENILDIDAIQKDVLKTLLMYLSGIQGSVRERLVTRCESIIEASTDTDDKVMKRALKVLSVLTDTSDEQQLE